MIVEWLSHTKKLERRPSCLGLQRGCPGVVAATCPVLLMLRIRHRLCPARRGSGPLAMTVSGSLVPVDGRQRSFQAAMRCVR